MTAMRQHHPACSSNWGGLCTSCPAVTRAETAHEPDITCECGETYVIAADSIAARRAALAQWSGCCTPNSSEALGEVASEDTGADLSASSPRADRQAAGIEPDPALPAATQRRGLLSGAPAWAVRRWAVGR